MKKSVLNSFFGILFSFNAYSLDNVTCKSEQPTEPKLSEVILGYWQVTELNDVDFSEMKRIKKEIFEATYKDLKKYDLNLFIEFCQAAKVTPNPINLFTLASASEEQKAGQIKRQLEDIAYDCRRDLEKKTNVVYEQIDIIAFHGNNQTSEYDISHYKLMSQGKVIKQYIYNDYQPERDDFTLQLLDDETKEIHAIDSDKDIYKIRIEIVNNDNLKAFEID